MPRLLAIVLLALSASTVEAAPRHHARHHHRFRMERAVRLIPDLLLYKRYGEKAGTVTTDLSTTGATGTLENGPALNISSGLFRDPNTALSCGTTSMKRDRMGSVGALNVTAFTIAFGIRIVTSVAYTFIFYNSNATSASGFGVQVVNDTAQVECCANLGGGCVRDATPPTEGAWHYYLVAYDGVTGTISANGERKATLAMIVPTYAVSTTVMAGARPQNDLNNDEIELDELAMWSRSLTGAEQRALYSAWAGR